MTANLSRRLTAGCLLLATLFLAACQSGPPDIGAHEDSLAAAGFVMRPASTPERQAMIARLPQHQFVIRQNGDVIHYVYADSTVCGCLYVGTQQAYDQYRSNQLAQHIADQNQLAAQEYNDAAWNWEMWGPWGPVGPPYGFVYGPVGW
jgi:hypothetical protein